MDLSSALWVGWVAAFLALEYVGLQDPKDERHTLTNRIRMVMATSKAARWLVAAALAVGLAWVGYHFIIVDPVTHPGAVILWT
jgi:hypothetical protein